MRAARTSTLVPAALLLAACVTGVANAGSVTRSATVAIDKDNVDAGTKVKVSGDVTSSRERCIDHKRVKIQRRKLHGKGFKTISRTRTSEDGSYAVKIVAHRTQKLRTVVPGRSCPRVVAGPLTLHVAG